MKNLVRNVAFVLGANVTKQTKEAELRGLMKKLMPWDCGKELVRLGGNGDGGYLLPNDFGDIEYCFSPGVGPVAEFENHLATFNIKSFLADHSIDNLPVNRPEFTFDKKFLGANDTEISFTLESWKDKYLPHYNGDLLLQMDIEGSEYEAIIATPVEVLNQFRIMVIEFHFLEKLFDPFVFVLYRACFERILKCFHVAHIHPNNCCGVVKKGDLEIPRHMEFTLYNKKRVGGKKRRGDFPHSLDRDNVSERKPLALPACWYK